MQVFVLRWTDDPRGHTTAVFLASSMEVLKPMFMTWYDREKKNPDRCDFKLSAEDRWNQLIEDQGFGAITQGLANEGFVLITEFSCS